MSLKFPYEGQTHGTLMALNNHVLVAPERGQYPCRSGSTESCDILVKFDDAKAITMFATSGDDHNGLISTGGDCLKKLQGAKKVMVRLPAYQDGYADFEFDVVGLKPVANHS